MHWHVLVLNELWYRSRMSNEQGTLPSRLDRLGECV